MSNTLKIFGLILCCLSALLLCTANGAMADSGGFDPVYDGQQKFETHPDHFLRDFGDRDRDHRDDREDRADLRRDRKDDRDDRDRHDDRDDDDDDRKLIFRHDTWHDFDPREDFGRDSYRDLVDMRKPEIRDDIDHGRDDKRDDTGDGDKRDDDHDDDSDLSTDHDPLHYDPLKYLVDRDKKKLKEDDKKEFRDLIKPYRGRFHDWVPAKVDRLQNGAFGKEPDNGFPVPYRLNGHLDIQRKLPWEAEPD